MKDLRNELNIVCPQAKGSYLEKAPPEIWEDPGWVLEPKIDGCRGTLQIGSERSLMVGRNRQDKLLGVEKAGDFRMLEGVPPEYLSKTAIEKYKLTILDGEQTEMIRQDGSFDKATLKNLKVGLFAGYTTWGAMFYCGQDVRSWPEHARRALARIAVTEIGWEKVKLIEQYPATKENLAKIFLMGYEGAVAKRIDAPLPLEARTNPMWWKLKGSKDRTVDAFVIGVSEGRANGSPKQKIEPIPNGTATSFTVGMRHADGTILEVGKMENLSEAAVEWGYRCFWRYKGKVAEMQVSGWEGERFRQPRFLKWRRDKGAEDCKFEEQIGG